ncbi:LOW QUALITY PROTEIN: conserved hypothetical protein, partial [Brucella melitensis bv. 3 str. Ether]
NQDSTYHFYAQCSICYIDALSRWLCNGRFQHRKGGTGCFGHNRIGATGRACRNRYGQAFRSVSNQERRFRAQFHPMGQKPVPWANPDTGSQGTITTIAESSTNNKLCRQFETSREAFDGVSIYRGETCMERGGQWTVTAFAPI